MIVKVWHGCTECSGSSTLYSAPEGTTKESLAGLYKAWREWYNKVYYPAYHRKTPIAYSSFDDRLVWEGFKELKPDFEVSEEGEVYNGS